MHSHREGLFVNAGDLRKALIRFVRQSIKASKESSDVPLGTFAGGKFTETHVLTITGIKRTGTGREVRVEGDLRRSGSSISMPALANVYTELIATWSGNLRVSMPIPTEDLPND